MSKAESLSVRNMSTAKCDVQPTASCHVVLSPITRKVSPRTLRNNHAWCSITSVQYSGRPSECRFPRPLHRGYYTGKYIVCLIAIAASDVRCIPAQCAYSFQKQQLMKAKIGNKVFRVFLETSNMTYKIFLLTNFSISFYLLNGKTAPTDEMFFLIANNWNSKVFAGKFNCCYYFCLQ